MNKGKWLLCSLLLMGSVTWAQSFDEEEEFPEEQVTEEQVTEDPAPVEVQQPKVEPKAKLAPVKPQVVVPPPPPKVDVSEEAEAPQLIVTVNQEYDTTKALDEIVNGRLNRQFVTVHASDNSIEPFECVTSTGTATPDMTDTGMPGETTTYRSDSDPDAVNGYFQVYGIERDGSSNLFENAPMPFKVRFNGAEALHESNLTVNGAPASHGCVRLKRDCAEKIFNLVEKFGQREDGKYNTRVYVVGDVHVTSKVLEAKFAKMNTKLSNLHFSHKEAGTKLKKTIAANDVDIYGRQYVRDEQTGVYLPNGVAVEGAVAENDGEKDTVSDTDLIEEQPTYKNGKRRNRFDDSVSSGVGGVIEDIGDGIGAVGDFLVSPFESKKKCKDLNGKKVSCGKLKKRGACMKGRQEVVCSVSQ